MSEFLIERACPLCGADCSSMKPEISSARPAEVLSVDELRSLFLGIRRDQVFFSYVRCSGCDLLYCPVFFSSATLGLLYEEMPDNTSVAGLPATALTQRRYVTLLNQSRVKNHLLDIGSDIGLLGEAFLERYGGEVSCVEPNKTVWPEIGKRLGEDTRIFETVDDVPKNLELTAMSAVHVIDHLLDPRDYLVKLRKQASQHTELLIVVHNEKSVLRKLMGRKWPPFCLQHPQIFNSATLSRLLVKSGWDEVGKGLTTNYVSPSIAAAQTMAILFGMKPLKKIPLSSFVVPVLTGNLFSLSLPQSDGHEGAGEPRAKN